MIKILKDDEFVDKGDEDFATLFAKREQMSKDVSGSMQVGNIVELNNDNVMVAITNEKLEARLDISEITDENGNVMFKKGDDIEVFVTPGRGRPNASYKKAIKFKKTLEKINEIEKDYKNKIIEAKVVKKNRGGYILEYDGIDVFMPRRDASFKDDAKVLGNTYKVAIVSIDKESNSIVVSRKKFFELSDKSRQEISEKLLGNDVEQSGIITKIAPFGIFVDVCGLEGLVHYTELSHRGPINPAKHFKEGDKVLVKVLGYDEKKRRLSLSMKAVSENPWSEVEKELEVGYVVKVSVSNIEPYGVFVDLGNDIEAFLHISEITWDKSIKHPSSHLEIGQEIDVEIIEIDTEKQRLRVSLKRLLDKPFAKFAKTHQAGDIVKGKIATTTDFGAFVNIGGVDGLLHNDDASWDKGYKCSDNLNVGDEIEVKILRIDKNQERISLSKKALEDSPIKDFAKSHKVDDVVKAQVIEVKDFGVFIKIDDTEALIRSEDLFPLKREDIKPQDEIECVIAHIDEENNRIRASVKRLEKQKEKENLKAFNSNEKMTLGDKLKNRL